MQNADGLWLRLSSQSIREFCSPLNGFTEGWALQYNQHTARTLLVPAHTHAAPAQPPHQQQQQQQRRRWGDADEWAWPRPVLTSQRDASVSDEDGRASQIHSTDPGQYHCWLSTAALLFGLVSLHTFNSFFSSTPWVRQYQKGKTSLDLHGTRDDGVL